MTFRSKIKAIAPPFASTCIREVLAAIWFKCNFEKLLANNHKLRGSLAGEDIYLIGSGPSINSQDLKYLVNKNVMFINNMFVHAAFSDIIRGTGYKAILFGPIHAPQTIKEWVKWLKTMNDATANNINIFAGLMMGNYRVDYLIKQNSLFRNRELWYYYAHRNVLTPGYKPSPVDWCLTGPIMMARASSVYGIICCNWLGARNIYLLGMDHNYVLFNKESEMRCYSNAIHQNNELERTFGNHFYEEEWLRQYEIFTQYRILKEGIEAKLYNLSPSSLCRVFPYVNYESTLT